MEKSLLFILTKYFGPIFLQLQKFVEKPNLIRISSNFLHNISTYTCISKYIKINIFSFVILTKFGQNLLLLVQGL